MYELQSEVINLNHTPNPSFNLMISQEFLQAIFYISLIITIVFTIVLFAHWKKYAPEPLKIFLYSIIYLVGAGIFIFGQLLLLSAY